MKRAHAGAAVLIAACVLAAFSPAFSGGFLYWDDDKNFLETQGWRGLGLENLRWMATTLRGGPYQPLSWLSIGIDHAIFGMDARGYHATNVLLHAATAVAFFYLARRIFALAVPGMPRKEIAAACAALLFAVHPLRVESVAWITERRDVLSGVFVALSLLAYLSCAAGNLRKRRLAYIASLIAFVLALLAKASALALPVVLLLIDRWPLRRPLRASLLEKVPFAIVAAVFGAVALVGQASLPHGMRTIEEHGPLDRLAQAAYAALFYPAKTLLPIRLSPIYELPTTFDPFSPRFVGAACLAIAVTAIAVVRRRRAPAAAVAWGAFLVLLAPVSGIVQTGPQLVADRYSYLPCISFALLAAGCLFARAPRIAPVIASAVVLVLGAATWKQTRYWRDTETLFARALELDPESSIAHGVVARMLAMRGARDEAQTHYRRAIELAPRRPLPHNNLGLLLFEEGRYDEAVFEFREALRVQDDYGRARVNLGAALVKVGDPRGGEAVLREALRRDPADPGARTNLGLALLAQDRAAEAVLELEAALRANPSSAEARAGLARARAKLGKQAP